MYGNEAIKPKKEICAVLIETFRIESLLKSESGIRAAQQWKSKQFQYTEYRGCNFTKDKGKYGV